MSGQRPPHNPGRYTKADKILLAAALVILTIATLVGLNK